MQGGVHLTSKCMRHLETRLHAFVSTKVESNRGIVNMSERLSPPALRFVAFGSALALKRHRADLCNP